MGTDANTPPYLNDTLRWAALELRYPVADELSIPGPPAVFRDLLHPVFPIQEDQTEVGIAIGASGPGAQQIVRHRFLTRDRLMSATVSRDVIVLETTQYPGWTQLRDQFIDVLRALAEARVPDGLSRVGLRYIDEIRVPVAVETVADWVGWVSPALTAVFGLRPNAAPTAVTAALQYGSPPGFVTAFRAAPLAEGRTVHDEGPLRLPFETAAGPYFLLDTDSSWVDPSRQVPEFDIEEVIRISNELHDACIELYEASIGPRLRSEVLERPREEVQVN